MDIHGPAAVSDRIGEDPVCQHVIFRQHIIAVQPAAFSVTGNDADPVQIVVFHTVVTHVLQVIPHAVDTADQLITDHFAVTGHLIAVAGDFDPPVAGGGVVIVGQLAAAGLLLGVNAAVAGIEHHAGGMGTDRQILFGEVVSPLGRHILYRLASVHRGEQQGVTHAVVVGNLRCGGFGEFISAFGTDAVLGAGEHTQCAVAGGIHEDVSGQMHLGFGGILVANDAADVLTVHHHILHGGVQVRIQMLLLVCHFPHHGVKHRERSIGIAAFVLQQQFLNQAGFTHIVLGCVAVRADDVHSDFRAGITAKHGTALHNCDTRTLSCRRHRSEKACQTAADNDDIIIRSELSYCHCCSSSENLTVYFLNSSTKNISQQKWNVNCRPLDSLISSCSTIYNAVFCLLF